MQVREILSVAVLGSLLAACGASTTSTQPRMSVHLVDGPSQDYSEVNIDVQRVEIAGADGWVVLGEPNRVINLLALTGGVEETLVNGATLPAGHYGQMRLVLGPQNTVKLAGATGTEPLKVPSGQQSGVKLTVNFDVQPGTTSDVFIDFDVERSVFVHKAGASGQYILRPTVRAFDKMVTGSVSGTLTTAGATAGSLAPLAGVVVTAQTVGASGPAVVRSTTTDAAGHYVLDLLPEGGSYYVVSQPVVPAAGATPAASYAPQAGGPFAIAAATPTATFDATFSLAEATGEVDGAITPVASASQADTVNALLPILVGGATQTLIVRTVPAVVATTETYAIPLLPVALPSTTYSLVLERRSIDASGIETSQLVTVDAVTVTPGPAVTQDIVVP